ncbi:MAG: formyltetrahydrofolate deformylase, partial [Henriciella sp.]|nr:formyltetrahydrofolate deformylase [Henriciella sp.]
MTKISTSVLLRMICPDRPGILAEISPFLRDAGCDIRESDIYGDTQTGQFFVRMVLTSAAAPLTELKASLAPIAEQLCQFWEMKNLEQPTRVVFAVSKFEHCLADLLFKHSIGALPVDIAAVISNHDKARALVESYGFPFHHLPISKETKPQQEAKILKLFEGYDADLLVLARYMQILSDDLSKTLSGRCINIHHSFLPSFKGAKPYHQAHLRGVKLIGATAHYVTSDLDEGPIIEQDVRRVTHKATAEQMVEYGRDVEASVLSRAVKWHAEGRV